MLHKPHFDKLKYMRTQYKYDLDFYKQWNNNFVNFGQKFFHLHICGLTDETGLASVAFVQAIIELSIKQFAIGNIFEKWQLKSW